MRPSHARMASVELDSEICTPASDVKPSSTKVFARAVLASVGSVVPFGAMKMAPVAAADLAALVALAEEVLRAVAVSIVAAT